MNLSDVLKDKPLMTSFDWGVSIDGITSPYGDELPAIRTDLDLASVSHFNVNIGGVPFSIPSGSGSGLGFSISFYDDRSATVLRQMIQWFREAGGFNNKGRAPNMAKTAKLLTLTIGNSCGGGNGTANVLVVPHGTVKFNGTNEIGAIDFTASFVIVGVP